MFLNGKSDRWTALSRSVRDLNGSNLYFLLHRFWLLMIGQDPQIETALWTRWKRYPATREIMQKTKHGHRAYLRWKKKAALLCCALQDAACVTILTSTSLFWVLSDPANASIFSVLTVIDRLLTKTEHEGLWEEII